MRHAKPLSSMLLVVCTGCLSKSVTLTEVTGKTSFGPEFRNFGNNTQDVRYTAIQALEFKLSNKWTVGMSYQRRDLDDGAGDNENLVLFEVGYPLWNAPKPEKTAAELQIEQLENQLRELGGELALAESGKTRWPAWLADDECQASQSSQKGD